MATRLQTSEPRGAVSMAVRLGACLLAGLLACAEVSEAQPAPAAEGRALTFKDRGKTAVFPLGAASFADEVVAFVQGTPAVRDKRWSDPARVVGLPDYKGGTAERKVQTSLTMGCGGVLTVRFTDNALVDAAGPDFYVFEIGPAIEPTLIEISPDGQRWIDAGRIGGGLAALDIAKVAEPGEAYPYVRLTDARSACGGGTPGADIDAIGAIGSALQLSLDSAVLFDSGRSELKPAARRELDAVAARLAEFPKARVSIDGHTDDVGTDAANQALSDARARAVREFFAASARLKGLTFVSRGFGESRPIAPNDTDQGRARNRRVAIVVVPAR
jgi:OOP family OmpA-OmpF porin